MEVSTISLVQNGLMRSDSASSETRLFSHSGSVTHLSTDELAFQSSMASHVTGSGVDNSVSQVAQALFEPLNHINNEAAALAEYAQAALESQNTLSPGEMVALTVRSQEFMFHSQLTANIANRTADGIQQLFRQQS